MKRRRFGGDDSSREDAEREAREELERLTRRAGGPPSSYSPPSYSPPPSRSQPPAPSAPAPRTSWDRPPPPQLDDEDYDDDDEDYDRPLTAREEAEAVTGLALQDWAQWGRGGRRPEDYALPRLDPQSLEAQRDRALREVMERQRRMQREYQEGLRNAPPDDRPKLPASGGMSQHEVLRASKPPGMMNMAAAQVGALNRDWMARGTPPEEDLEEAATPAPVEKRTAKKPTATRPTAKKGAVEKGIPKKGTPEKGTVKKATATKGTAKKVAAEKAPAKKGPAKKAPARTPTRTAAAAEKAPAKKAPVRKPAARTAPGKKTAAKAPAGTARADTAAATAPRGKKAPAPRTTAAAKKPTAAKALPRTPRTPRRP